MNGSQKVHLENQRRRLREAERLRKKEEQKLLDRLKRRETWTVEEILRREG